MIIHALGNNRWLLRTLTLFIAGLAFGPEPAHPQSKTVMAEPDLLFIREAAAIDNLEIKMSRIAALRANSDRVRQFAKSLIGPATRTLWKLKEIALLNDVRLHDKLDQKRAQHFLALDRHTGDEFDLEYLTRLAEQKRRAVRLFEQQAQKDRDDGLRSFAQSRLSPLEIELKEAQVLADQN